MDLQKPKRKLIQRVGSFFSWAAGLSLGSLVFGILLTLVALAIFVRTDFFQRNLKNKIVELSQKNLETDISYESAEVEIFKFYPRLSFYKVQMKDRETDSVVDVDRVSVSISALVSIPLLVFQRIYISTAEVDGLSYELYDTEVLKDWMQRLNPSRRKDDDQPKASGFSASIDSIRFRNFRLKVELSKEDIFKRPVMGVFELKDFRLGFDDEEILFDGEFPFKDLEVGPIKVPTGQMVIEDGKYIGRTISFDRLAISNGDDEIELSGSIGGFENPNLNLRGTTHLLLENYLTIPAKGVLSTNFRYQGQWKKGKGTFEFNLKDGWLKSRSFENVSAQLRLRDSRAEIIRFTLQDGNERLDAKGSIGLSSSVSSDFELQLKKLNLSRWLGLVADHLSLWKGIVDGSINLRGDLIAGKLKGTAKLKVDGYEVRTETSSKYSAPPTQANVQINFESWDRAQFQSSVTTEHSDWVSNMRWTDKEFWIDWKGNVHGPMGTLFFFNIEPHGVVEGFYGGPFMTMDLKIVPKLDLLKLNNYVFKNVRGQIDFDEKRQFVANPLLSDQFRMEGGFLFPRNDRPTEFYNFDFQAKNMDSMSVLNALPMTRDWAFKPEGKVDAEGMFDGRIESPRAEGTIKLSDFRFGTESEARTLSSQWRFDDGMFRAFDVNFAGPKEAGVISGGLLLSTSRIEELQVNGNNIRLSDWASVFGLKSPIQSRADFNFNFEAARAQLGLKGKLYETTLGSHSEGPSTFEMSSSKSNFDLKARFFGEKALMEGSSRGQVANVNMRLINFDIAQLATTLNRGGLKWDLSGAGNCEFRLDKKGQTTLFSLLPYLDRTNCRWIFEKSNVLRGNATLYRVENFNLEMNTSQTGFAIWRTPGISINSPRKKMLVSGMFQSDKNLNFKVEGNTSLEAAAYFLPALSRSDGEVEVDGTWTNSGFTGALKINDGLFAFRDNPILVRDVEANLKSQNSKFEIQNLSGSFREGGVTANGRFHLKGFDLENLQINSQLNGTLVEPDNGIRFRTTGPLFIRQEGKGGKISGQLTVTEGRFRKRINLRSDFAKLFSKESKKYEFYIHEESLFDDWNLDLALVTGEPFQVRNNVAEIDLDANLKLMGTVPNPRFYGSLSALRGRFNYFNRSFELRTATAQFNNPDSNIPRYDIQADTEAGEYRVFLNIVGDANRQKVVYSSDPPLAEKEILNLISTGVPPSSSDQVVQDDKTTSAAYAGISFVTGQLQDTIETALSSEFGIQRFQLYPSFYGETGKTELQLKVGTDLVRNRLSLNYSNYISATGGQLVELDLKMNRHISLVGSWRDTQTDQKQNISGDLGGDILFRFEIK